MKDFSALGLPQPLLHALEKMRFTTPTPIQAQAIPPALKGQDILGSAQTGTGKTGAFGIPLLAHLMESKQSGALVMTPTRELAAQVLAALREMLSGNAQIKTALLIGGDPMARQLQQLRARPRIIVGTPGRINDHLEQRTLNLSAMDFLVLDETDRMLDMGFEVQIDRIVRHMPKVRQTLLFSATLPANIVKMSEKYLNKPVRVAVGSTHMPIDKIKQELVHLPAAEKYEQLVKQLGERKGSIIVFVKTKRGADRIAKKLNADKHSAEAIHGDLSQSKRTRVIKAFRDQGHRIMVATDVAARGLDIPHIEHVINYDLPQCPEDYIHRIGRTARAGAEGSAVCFITPDDRGMWREIQALMDPSGRSQDSERSGGRSGGAVTPLRDQRVAPKAHRKGRSPSASGRSRDDRSKEGRSFAGGRPAERSRYSEEKQRNTRSRGDRPSERSFRSESAGSRRPVRAEGRAEGRSEGRAASRPAGRSTERTGKPAARPASRSTGRPGARPNGKSGGYSRGRSGGGR